MRNTRRDAPNFLTEARVLEWLAVPGNGGEAALRSMLASGELGDGEQHRVVAGYFRRLDAIGESAQQAAEFDLARRSTEAAERSAQEAQRSGDIANTAKRWSIVSAVSALVAAAFTAWPYVFPAKLSATPPGDARPGSVPSNRGNVVEGLGSHAVPPSAPASR